MARHRPGCGVLLAALATLPLGIVGLLSNFSLVGVFVTGAP